MAVAFGLLPEFRGVGDDTARGRSREGALAQRDRLAQMPLDHAALLAMGLPLSPRALAIFRHYATGKAADDYLFEGSEPRTLIANPRQPIRRNGS